MAAVLAVDEEQPITTIKPPFPRFFETRSRAFWVVFTAVLIGLVGFVNFRFGFEYSFSLFYLVPISLVAWFQGRWAGIAASAASALVWLAADIFDPGVSDRPDVYLWNVTIRAGIFYIVSVLLAEVRAQLERIKEISETDFLTGVCNARKFNELLEQEINRARRSGRAFTLISFDIDNFKHINDRYGHSEGDRLLTQVALKVRDTIRDSDRVARLGGDEFACLFPETGQEAAEPLVGRLVADLKASLALEAWEVSLSTGAITFDRPPRSADEAFQIADELMYAVKNRGKDGVAFDVYSRRAPTAEDFPPSSIPG